MDWSDLLGGGMEVLAWLAGGVPTRGTPTGEGEKNRGRRGYVAPTSASGLVLGEEEGIPPQIPRGASE